MARWVLYAGGSWQGDAVPRTYKDVCVELDTAQKSLAFGVSYRPEELREDDPMFSCVDEID